jgi:hypothetical protein
VDPEERHILDLNGVFLDTVNLHVQIVVGIEVIFLRKIQSEIENVILGPVGKVLWNNQVTSCKYLWPGIAGMWLGSGKFWGKFP